ARSQRLIMQGGASPSRTGKQTNPTPMWQYTNPAPAPRQRSALSRSQRSYVLYSQLDRRGTSIGPCGASWNGDKAQGVIRYAAPGLRLYPARPALTPQVGALWASLPQPWPL